MVADWDSSVHSHWSLIRTLRLCDTVPEESDILAGLESRFTDENVEQEVDYLRMDDSFEKPYGWAWFLRLASELQLWKDDRANEWREILRPLEDRIVSLVDTAFLPQNRAFRVGTHHNSAFALAGILDYAKVTSNDALWAVAAETARKFYVDDTDYPVEYEPLLGLSLTIIDRGRPNATCA